MAQWNQFSGIGNLTTDPKLTYTPSGTAVAEFRLAFNTSHSNSNGTQKQRVCYIDARCFGKTAEAVSKHLAKGAPVFVAGRLDFDQWTDNAGAKHSKHSLTLDTVQFLMSRKSDQSEQQEG